MTLTDAVAVDNVTRARGVDQRDIPRQRRVETDLLLHRCFTGKLERHIVLRAFTPFTIMQRAELSGLSHVDKTHFEFTAVVLINRARKLRPQRIGTKAPADLIDPFEPLIKALDLLCIAHRSLPRISRCDAPCTFRSCRSPPRNTVVATPVRARLLRSDRSCAPGTDIVVTRHAIWHAQPTNWQTGKRARKSRALVSKKTANLRSRTRTDATPCSSPPCFVSRRWR